jgi:hypothetical protein
VLLYKLAGNKLILLMPGPSPILSVYKPGCRPVTYKKKPLSIKGEIDLQLYPQGLYYRTEDQINIWDVETGEKKMGKRF